MNEQNSITIQPGGPAGAGRGKLFAAYFSLAMIGAVLWPLHQNWAAKPKDNFPLSYYPMFSVKREATESFYYMLGKDDQGGRYYLPYSFAGPGGLNSVRRQIRRIANEGRAPELAASVARKVRRKTDEPWSKIVSVAVVRGDFVVDDFYHGKKEPVKEQIKASSPVTRKTQ